MAVSAAGENLWGETVADDAVSAADMPDVDVLELDCEGVELDILRNMGQRPRVLIVEAHPQFGVDLADVRSLMTENGYTIQEEELQPTDEDVGWFAGVNNE